MKIGILITSCPSHKHCVIECLKRYAGLGYPIAFGWDGEKFNIGRDVAKIVFTGKRLGLQAGEKFMIHYCAERLAEAGCEYVFKACGDVDIGHPERIAELSEKLGNFDFICNNWDGAGMHFGTKIFFGKLEPLLKVSDKWKNDDSGKHLEKQYAETMKELGITFKAMDDVDDKKEDGFWYGWLGCKHLKE